MSREIRFPAAAVAALAKGNRLEAIKLVREANHGVDLRGAMEAVDAHASGSRHFPVDAQQAPAVHAFNGLPAEAIAAVSRGDLIEAIKRVRQATGLGLKEAKDLVDGYRENPGTASTPHLDDKLEEIARKHGVEISPAAVAALDRGDLIEAIKLVRQENRIGLKQARDLVQGHASTSAQSSSVARRAPTVSTEANRNGWLWALLLLGALAAAWALMAR